MRSTPTRKIGALRPFCSRVNATLSSYQMQTFKSSQLGFTICYPDSWQVVPAQWTKQFIGRAKNTSSKLAEYLSAGSPPFLVVHDPHVQPGLAIPTLRCQAYSAAAIAAAGGISGVLQSMTGHLRQAFPDFEMHEYSPECLVSGVLGGRLTASMSALNAEHESFHATSEILLLPTKAFVLAISLSATSEMSYRPENEFIEIKRSIRLQSPA